MPSFSRFGSMKFSRFHRCLRRRRQLTPPRSRRATRAPVWERMQTQLTLFNHPHMVAFILILLMTFMRPSELLALRKKRSCPTACATSPMLVDRDRSFRNWSVQQNWNPRWVCSHGPASPQVPGHVPNASKWSRHRSGARFRNIARSAETRSVEGLQQCQMIRQKQSFGGSLPLSPAPTPKQAANTRATCRGVVDKATASPAA